ncbi:efflux RND transporter periplasmic adaptor subunit [Labilibaculum manganireducens]|uniref:efflux RND transporter periplasmic adaptor subunit n=1 Tax=Labilibaculum manganireducens TaxID=1940525 RepID=UPI0029F54974|nr:efflux RND transporter periplasmic adaptor subunit [Labilibaculum manganireducens]
MKKNINRLMYIAIVAIICTLCFLQLKANKESTTKTAELGNIKGQYYPVKALVIKSIKPVSKFSSTGFLESETDLNLISETQGRIVEIYKSKGDYVNKGDIIAKVDDELLKAQLDASKAALEQLEKEDARFTKLVKENAATSQQLEDIQLKLKTTRAKYISANRQLEDTKIKAPVSGYIEDKYIDMGQFIGGGAKICNIIDAVNLKLKVTISEQDYSGINIGQKVIITSSIYPDKFFEGYISYIGKKAGYGNSFDTEIKLKNNGEKLLKAGMFVSSEILLKSDSASFFVPRKAINGSLKDASVYTIANGKAVLKTITIGKVIDSQVQVLEGLNSGEQVIIDGNYSIFDGATVEVIK